MFLMGVFFAVSGSAAAASVVEYRALLMVRNRSDDALLPVDRRPKPSAP